MPVGGQHLSASENLRTMLSLGKRTHYTSSFFLEDDGPVHSYPSIPLTTKYFTYQKLEFGSNNIHNGHYGTMSRRFDFGHLASILTKKRKERN